MTDIPLRLRSEWRSNLQPNYIVSNKEANVIDADLCAIDGGGVLDASDPDAVLAAVEAAPHRYVAGEPLVWSRAPRLDAGTLTACEVSWRAFTVAHGSGYRPLAGGLGSVLRDMMAPRQTEAHA